HRLAQQRLNIGNVEGKVRRVDLHDQTATPEPLHRERQLTPGYQDQMQSIRRSPAQSFEDPRGVAVRPQPMQIIKNNNEVLAQATAQPETDGCH
ncbi:MAG TPA: hypothetical protein VF788_08820, partial [Pseudonocardiaceae bacterium]